MGFIFKKSLLNYADEISQKNTSNKDEKKAVVFIKKQPFDTAQGQSLLSECDLKLDLKNDVYHSYDGHLPIRLQPTRYTMVRSF